MSRLKIKHFRLLIYLLVFLFTPVYIFSAAVCVPYNPDSISLLQPRPPSNDPYTVGVQVHELQRNLTIHPANSIIDS